MRERPKVVCSCGQVLPRPIPKTCPNCQGEIKRIDQSTAGIWLPVVLVILMFGILLGLILFIGYYMN